MPINGIAILQFIYLLHPQVAINLLDDFFDGKYVVYTRKMLPSLMVQGPVF